MFDKTRMIARIAIVTAPILLVAACASQGDLDAVKATANQALSTANAAKAEADQAIATAQAADQKATQAQADAKAADDKASRMFQRGLRK